MDKTYCNPQKPYMSLMDIAYCKNQEGGKMTTILAAPKISAGNRIALSDDVCDALGVSIGERIVIIRTEQGDIILKKAIA